MDVAGVLQFIQSIGFPAACVLIMFKQLDEERTAHKEEMRQMTVALNNNTVILTALKQRLDDMAAEEVSNE